MYSAVLILFFRGFHQPLNGLIFTLSKTKIKVFIFVVILKPIPFQYFNFIMYVNSLSNITDDIFLVDVSICCIEKLCIPF